MKNLVEHIEYDVTSPSLMVWRHKKFKADKGDPVNVWENAHGYLAFNFLGRIYLVHRVVYQLHNLETDLTGLEIDHLNRIRKDNRIENLRLVTTLLNCRNRSKRKTNTSGRTGVSYDKYRPRWRAFWSDEDGKLRIKGFSVLKYGYDEAYQLACEFREQKMKELREQGMGYTNDHGI